MTTRATTPTPRSSHPGPGIRLAARSGLDVMLTDAALEDRGVARFLKPRAAGRTLAGLARHPRRAVRDAGGFSLELARVATGWSEVAPAKGDRRFAG
jgi:polyhydroxyalkanoate synthase subunit PhaC